VLWRPSRIAAAASSLVLLASFGLDGSQAFAERPLIADLKWVHTDADAVAALTMIPAECLVMSRNAERARLVRLGRVAFRSPVLLGGLAARVGMSCDSCHRNGHDNPVFHFTGVSGDPGTADVTGSVFSTNRDDGRLNPVVIPTLVDVASAPPFGTMRPVPDLRTFLHAAVVDEFQGEPPPQSVVEGMLAYIEGLQSAGCPKRRSEVVSFEADARELLGIIDVVIETLEHDDRHGGLFALTSLRAALERVYRRFPERVSAREELIGLSRALSRLRELLEEQGVPETIAVLTAERLQLEAVLRKLGTQVHTSFYDPGVLRSALDSAP